MLFIVPMMGIFSTPFHIFPHLPNNIIFFNPAVNLYLIFSAFLYILLVYPLYRLYSKCIFKYKSMKINQRLTLCFSLLFCLLSISYASAQQLNISGVVISSEDNEPLIGATVSVKGNPTKGVITDINGQFQLSVETGTKMLSYLMWE